MRWPLYIAVVALTVLAGCGVKGPLYLPQARLPPEGSALPPFIAVFPAFLPALNDRAQDAVPRVCSRSVVNVPV
jgi:predicted small lipoprotein YifL